MTPSAVGKLFWTKVNKNGPIPEYRPDLGPCWLWLGRVCCKERPYGQFYVDGSYRQAHRVAYTLLVGPIPEGKVLDHLCRTHRCVNPAHVEPVTNKENILRGYGATAMCARKTVCPKGHPLTGDNLVSGYPAKRGWRRCRICLIAGRKQWVRKRSEYRKHIPASDRERIPQKNTEWR